jgi:hypothetical protein
VSSPFLTAEWQKLAMLNYATDPTVLARLVPEGCELDSFAGTTFLSVVGFRFLDTRVLGLGVPFHRNFDEVNLRFYVRRRSAGEWRRGVVFVKELVPRFAIAAVARLVYGENYVSLPMRHEDEGGRLAYEWKGAAGWEGLEVRYQGEPTLPADDSEETFITEHYWGYARQRDGGTVEYRVEHPRWRVWRATEAMLECDVRSLYGDAFSEALSAPPTTAFVADGSSVRVLRGEKIV